MERQYVRSERAHFMCPNMHFGILVKVNAPYDAAKVGETIDILANAHPFLRSVMGWEQNYSRLFYQVSENSRVALTERESIQTIWQDYSGISKTNWNVFEEGLLKVFLYPDQEDFQVLFIAHHILADGRRLLELCCQFADLYVQGTRPDYAEERLIAEPSDLPPGSELSNVNRLLLAKANNQWKKEKRQATYDEYAAFAESFVREQPVAHMCSSLGQRGVEAMRILCHEQQISINDLLTARLFLTTKEPKIIMAADIQDKLYCYQQGALGNYASALSLYWKGRERDEIRLAKKVHKQAAVHLADNRKLMLILSCYLNLEGSLIDAAAIAALGCFDSKAARFVGRTMLGYGKGEGISITNLGAIENQNIREATFIPPASPAAKETFGIVTVNGRMALCCSFYEKSVTAESVREHITKLV